MRSRVVTRVRRSLRWPAAWLLSLMVALCACSGDKGEESLRDANKVRRIPRPSRVVMETAPPHSIQNSAVGPFALGEPVTGSAIRGASSRIVTMRLPKVVDYQLVKAEGGAITAGFYHRRLTFISVLQPGIARTDSSIGVGSTLEQLEASLGQPVIDPQLVARDPRITVYSRYPNLRFLAESGQVKAILVTEPSQSPRGAPRPARQGKKAKCDTDKLEKRRDQMTTRGLGGDIQITCYRGVAKAAALLATKNRFSLVSYRAGRQKVLLQRNVPHLVFARALDVDGDGRSEIVVVSQRLNQDEREVRLEVLRFTANGAQRLVSRGLFGVTARHAAWVGAELSQIDIMLEVAALSSDTVSVGGFLVIREGGGGFRAAVPLAAQRVALGKAPALPAGKTKPRPTSDVLRLRETP